jgi:hypothetical protein
MLGFVIDLLFMFFLLCFWKLQMLEIYEIVFPQSAGATHPVGSPAPDLCNTGADCKSLIKTLVVLLRAKNKYLISAALAKASTP